MSQRRRGSTMRAVHGVCAIAMVAMGMFGLYLNIDYSGLVLLVGIIWVFAA